MQQSSGLLLIPGWTGMTPYFPQSGKTLKSLHLYGLQFIELHIFRQFLHHYRFLKRLFAVLCKICQSNKR